jgi:hypothetical protein
MQEGSVVYRIRNLGAEKRIPSNAVAAPTSRIGRL